MVFPRYTPAKGDEIVYQNERLVVVRVDGAAVFFKGEACSGRVTRGTWMGMWREATARQILATVPALQEVATMTDNTDLRQALLQPRSPGWMLPVPYRHIHLIVEGTGEAYDEDRNFLVALTAAEIADLLEVLDYVELRTALDGALVRVVHQFELEQSC